MNPNHSESLLSQINSNVFFKEFTFSRNEFTQLDSKQRLELADGVVWLDDIFMVFQIKECTNVKGVTEKWFQNKILNKAVKQIKSTHNYLRKYSEIQIVNEKGHRRNISEANIHTIESVIIFSLDAEVEEVIRFQKFYKSRQVGLIHLFHVEDYYWVCKYLLTPAEVDEYLVFRKELYENHTLVLNNLPEQYVLAHFLETSDTSKIDVGFVDNLKKADMGIYDFNLSYLIENFDKDIKLVSEETDYYPILAEIAKLNRVELSEFKKRFSDSPAHYQYDFATASDNLSNRCSPKYLLLSL